MILPWHHKPGTHKHTNMHRILDPASPVHIYSYLHLYYASSVSHLSDFTDPRTKKFSYYKGQFGVDYRKSKLTGADRKMSYMYMCISQRKINQILFINV